MKNWLKNNKKELLLGCLINAVIWGINAHWATAGRVIWLGSLGWQRVITTPAEAIVIGILTPFMIVGCLWLSKNGRKEI